LKTAPGRDHALFMRRRAHSDSISVRRSWQIAVRLRLAPTCKRGEVSHGMALPQFSETGTT